MSILNKILQQKREEVSIREKQNPVSQLRDSPLFSRQVQSLRKSVALRRPGIIAEIKRRSPSKGVLCPSLSVEEVSQGYVGAGAAALSVLTDEQFFGGSNEDLTTARRLNHCPILRKDFIIAEYQLVEARSIGADAVLLIAAALEPTQLAELALLAKDLDLEVVVEVHKAEELEGIPWKHVDVIGVNNRDLQSFETTLDTSLKIAPLLPQGSVAISESGIFSVDDIVMLSEAGYQGFLIGEYFMKSVDPAKACAELLEQCKQRLAE